MKKRTKLALWLLGLFALFVILYNVFYLIFKFEEPIFFFLSLFFALAFVGAVFYDLFVYIEKLFESRKKLRVKLNSNLKKNKKKGLVSIT